MPTYYVIDGDEIINAIESHLTQAELEETVLPHFHNHERLRLDVRPSLKMLERYRYWNERP